MRYLVTVSLFARTLVEGFVYTTVRLEYSALPLCLICWNCPSLPSPIMKHINVSFIIIVTLFLSGCSFDNGRGDLYIETDKGLYFPNEPVHISITNDTAETIELLNCCRMVGYVLERQTTTGWELVDTFACLPNCDAIASPLPSGRQHREEIQITEPGQYRLAGKQIDTSAFSSIRTFYSSQFTVQ
jgi:hypothetical protein